ncbi:MAG: acyl-CoA esterase [marine bacterium B5-7]|nr:MAG: acyl-CoA esterase [marine bacterium B5-7]
MMRLNYTELGQGRPIIILHGLFGSARNWQGIARSLADSHHVITPDLRNHGQSPHAQSMSYQEMTNDIIAIADQLNLKDLIVMGHSMGGKVAMTAALTQPERFSSLIVVDIAPVNYEHDFDLLIMAMKSLNLNELKSRAQAEAVMSQTIDDTGVIQLLLQNLIRNGDKFQWRINLASIMENLSLIGEFPDTLRGKSCRIPTLFLGGSESVYLRNIYNADIFQYFPSAEITMIKGAGHWLHAEKPGEFLKEIKTFINFV